MDLTATQKKVALGVAVGALTAWAVLSGRSRRPRREYAPAEALVLRPEEDLWVERAAPDALRVRWTGPARAARVYPGHPAPAGQTPLAETAGATELLVPDGGGRLLHVVFADGERRPVAERFLRLPGAVNLRDIGGYAAADGRRVRWGRLWRSGSLAGLTEAGAAALAGQGVRVVCDLRTPQEAARMPDRVPAGVRYHLQPAYPDGNPTSWLKTLIFRRHELDQVFVENYLRMGGERAAAFGEVLRLAADPANQPCLIHCTAGKDRTGIAIALLLRVLGVPEATVIADYALSNLEYEAILVAAADDVRRAAAVGISAAELRPVMTANPVYLRRLLTQIDAQYGSVETYLLRAAGLTPAELESLRAHLLE